MESNQKTFARPLGRNVDELSTSASKSSFSILQWNTLSSHLTNTFPKANPEHLVTPYRQPLLAQELKAYSPDFVCLEEVNQDDVEFFKAVFDSTKYSSIYQIKHQGKDGLFFLYNQEKYELVKSDCQGYIDLEKNTKQSQVFQVNIFKHRDEEKEGKSYLLIAFTHLKAKEPFTAIRLEQVKQLVKIVEEAKRSFIESQKEADAKLGVVICGDFNDVPTSEPIKYLEQATKFKSAYEEITFTTFKIREKVQKRVIDYVFYNENLQLIAKSNIPTEETIGENGLPNAEYPSDHLSLFCKFVYN